MAGEGSSKMAQLITGQIVPHITDLHGRVTALELKAGGGNGQIPQPAPAPDLADGQTAEAWQKQSARWKSMYEIAKAETERAREAHVADLRAMVQTDKSSDRLARFSQRAQALNRSKATQAETKSQAATKPKAKRTPARKVQVAAATKGKQ